MQAVFDRISTERVKQQFSVDADHINDRGELATCIILKEIMALNDQVILTTLGSLDYYTFFTTWHRVELMNEIATAGEVVELVAEYYFTEDISLEISVTVRKSGGTRKIIMAEGYFSFTMKSNERRSVHLW
jgi:hypothetical protein